jgi:beta-galactosidase
VPDDYSIESDFFEKHIANAFVQSGVVWYRKHFQIVKSKSNQKDFLLFDGVSMNSQVWINGYF